MSHSSGLHERARLYKPFFARMHSSFGYDLLAPVRRDFSTLLDQCDHDLYRAVAEAAMRQDYTVFEHARDLAGAARWNAAAMIHRKDPAGPAALVPPARPAPGPDSAGAGEGPNVVGAEISGA
jgi:asparagine synthase (glutamine-hydrolysing)